MSRARALSLDRILAHLYLFACSTSWPLRPNHSMTSSWPAQLELGRPICTNNLQALGARKSDPNPGDEMLSFPSLNCLLILLCKSKKLGVILEVPVRWYPIIFHPPVAGSNLTEFTCQTGPKITRRLHADPESHKPLYSWVNLARALINYGKCLLNQLSQSSVRSN